MSAHAGIGSVAGSGCRRRRGSRRGRRDRGRGARGSGIPVGGRCLRLGGGLGRTRGAAALGERRVGVARGSRSRQQPPAATGGTAPGTGVGTGAGACCATGCTVGRGLVATRSSELLGFVAECQAHAIGLHVGDQNAVDRVALQHATRLAARGLAQERRVLAVDHHRAGERELAALHPRFRRIDQRASVPGAASD